MKITKKTFWNLFLLFEIIFLIKTGISLLRESAFIFPDETCIIKRAMFFIDNFKLESCQAITKMSTGDPHPLYSILISPIYFFTHGQKAYHIILILNSLIVSSIVFPLYKIAKKFIKNDTSIFATITLIAFLPQIISYEQTLMTETLFIVINIWCLYFYINSFEEKEKIKNKTIAVVLSLLAVLTRPFGFIVPLAIAINEFALSKRKKLFIALSPVIIALAIGSIYLFSPKVPEIIIEKIQSLSSLQNWIFIFKALKNQLNSLTLGTFFLPIIIFFTYINKKDSSTLKNIKYFLLALITMNFLISAQHIYGYFIYDNIDPHFITRYINISLILIITFGALFFQRYKKFELNKKTLAIIAIILIPFIFMNINSFKITLNLEFAYYIKATSVIKKDLGETKELVSMLLIPATLGLLTLLALKKRKAIIYILTTIIIIHSGLSYYWSISYAKESSIANFFRDKNVEISILTNGNDKDLLSVFWRLSSETRSQINLILINQDASDEIIKKEDMETSDYYKNAEYIITKHKMDLPVAMTTTKATVYKKP